MVRWRAFLSGLPKGVMNRGVREVLGVFLAGVGWSEFVRRGDRERDGEWNWEGGADIGGLGAGGAGLGVIGAELTSSTSPIS